MKPKTRDNLIYLAVGLSVAALLVADFFYADSHGTKMWVPSKLAYRAVYTTGLLAHFIVREARKLKATLTQILGCALLGSLLQLTVIFSFRQAVDRLPGLTFSALAVFETFLVFQLSMMLLRYLRH